VDPHHFDAGPDADPDSTYHPDADPDADQDPRFQIKAETNEKVLKYAHIPYILACHLQIDEDLDPVPDPAYHFDADLDFYLMRMRIQVTKMIRIRIHKTVMSIMNLFVTHLTHYDRVWRYIYLASFGSQYWLWY
jgi:hypothetical protein